MPPPATLAAALLALACAAAAQENSIAGEATGSGVAAGQAERSRRMAGDGADGDASSTAAGRPAQYPWAPWTPFVWNLTTANTSRAPSPSAPPLGPASAFVLWAPLLIAAAPPVPSSPTPLWPSASPLWWANPRIPEAPRRPPQQREPYYGASWGSPQSRTPSWSGAYWPYSPWGNSPWGYSPCMNTPWCAMPWAPTYAWYVPLTPYPYVGSWGRSVVPSTGEPEGEPSATERYGRYQNDDSVVSERSPSPTASSETRDSQEETTEESEAGEEERTEEYEEATVPPEESPTRRPSPAEEEEEEEEEAWPCKGKAPRGYVSLAGLEGGYKAHEEPLIWISARAACEAEGAHLAVPNSRREAIALWRLGRAARARIIHVGVSDIQVEGEWRTELGELVSRSGYNEWGGGQPDGRGLENCGALRDDLTYDDVKCNIPLPFVCEYPCSC